ncbi:DUF3813 domain-containing protein [Rossellomorea vietnamensis]|uniref:DUF3813 domain-containing protein n=1 Tax=Rossellomorea vietnamensis TaxID=218284 RepID=A0A0P6W1P6_9BACI|nr:DUF3813 domain-containing protein [Rossellomorea vietnamensis]KPL61439.1 hypothetical protein AM506_02080 [Rossellomorea vietnamensis]
MSNPLFQQARNAVSSAKQACNTGENAQMSIDKAKNALSSAYANSNVEEQKQLHALQDELNRLS